MTHIDVVVLLRVAAHLTGQGRLATVVGGTGGDERGVGGQ